MEDTFKALQARLHREYPTRERAERLERELWEAQDKILFSRKPRQPWPFGRGIAPRPFYDVKAVTGGNRPRKELPWKSRPTSRSR